MEKTNKALIYVAVGMFFMITSMAGIVFLANTFYNGIVGLLYASQNPILCSQAPDLNVGAVVSIMALMTVFGAVFGVAIKILWDTAFGMLRASKRIMEGENASRKPKANRRVGDKR